jgi:hypothetical protein
LLLCVGADHLPRGSARPGERVWPGAARQGP